MKQIFIACLFLLAGFVQAQELTIKGVLPQLKGEEITLKGYNGLEEEELAKTLCDSTGNFTLTYCSNYVGAGLLQMKGEGNAILMLNNESFSLQWANINDINTLVFINSPENDAFIKGYTVNHNANQKLIGLKYLLSQYDKFSEQYRWINDEIAFQNMLFEDFVNALPEKSFVAYYLKMRKYVSEMSQSAQKDDGRTIQHETNFYAINFNDDRLWHSGLLSEMFNVIYSLIANNKDTVEANVRINKLTDMWIKGLSLNSNRQQEVAEYCFKILEQHNLTLASEYIALSMFDQSGCLLDEKRTNLFEQYRKLALGNIAPDIIFDNGEKLSELKGDYIFVVFGASWCPNCQRDFPSLVGMYKRLNEKKKIEVIYISLDENLKDYKGFVKDAPFITYCDGKGWNGTAVKDYFVIATPTYILLDKHLKILKKIKNPEELYNIITF